MQELKEYNICVHTHEDLESVYSDLEGNGKGKFNVFPNRKVECTLRRPVSRNTHYLLTSDEAVQISKDPRIKFVEPVPDISRFKFSVSQYSNDWNKSNTSLTINNRQRNWGLLRCTEGTPRSGWGSNGTVLDVSGYANWNYTGQHVDVVICDGLFDQTHPELSGRRINYNWFSLNPTVTGGAAGVYDYYEYVGTYPEKHSTHVAGIAVGNTHGWARSANVYNIYPWLPGNTSLDYVKVWHQNKPINPLTGVKNPTIVNNSYEEYEGPFDYSSISRVRYRGVVYNGPFTRSQLESYGLIFDSLNRCCFPSQGQAIQQDYIDLIRAGIVVVGAAGNTGQKIDEVGGVDYNNNVTCNGVVYSYNRGSYSAAVSGSDRAICVGAISDTVEEYVMKVSARGPRIDVFAPGESINSSWPSNENTFSDPNYFFVYEAGDPVLDSRGAGYNYKLTGTSMSTPQVTGILACIAGKRISEGAPSFTQADALQYLQTTSGIGYLGDQPSPSQYNLAGSINRYLYFSPTGSPPAPVTMPPSYEVVPSSTNINEGDAISFSISTTNVPNGTVLYWTNAGTVSGADFVGGLNNGTFIINGGLGNFSKTLLNDLTTDGIESIVIQIRTDSITGPIVATSPTVWVNDTSQVINTPTYSISPNLTSVSEGSTVSFTITTTNLSNGTVLYWTNAGTTSASDFTDNVNSGLVVINSNSGVFSRTLLNDLTTEGSESIIVQIRTDSITGPVVATASTVSVNDTSQTPAGPVYSILPNTFSANEGDEVIFNVSTINVPDDTILYWTNVGTTNNLDFDDDQNSGSFVINSNSGSFTRTLLSDLTTEGAETIVIQVRTSSTSGPVVTTAGTVVINDNSQTPTIPTYVVSPTAEVIKEAQSITFNIVTSNVPNNAVLYWTNSGTISAEDFIDNKNQGTFRIFNNHAAVTLTLKNENITEGAETIIFEVREDSYLGPIVATSTPVTVTDITASITPDTIDINEGQLVSFSIETTNLEEGTTLYWVNIGTSKSYDFVDKVNQGTCVLDSLGTSEITRVVAEDFATEGDETITLQLRYGSYTGPVLITSVPVTVHDTSLSPRSYTISPNKTSIIEGESVVYKIVTSNVPDNTVIYWNNTGTTSSSKFVDNINTGTIVITSNVATLTRTLKENMETDGNQNIIINLGTTIDFNIPVATAKAVIAIDTSKEETTGDITWGTSYIGEFFSRTNLVLKIKKE